MTACIEPEVWSLHSNSDFWFSIFSHCVSVTSANNAINVTAIIFFIASLLKIVFHKTSLQILLLFSFRAPCSTDGFTAKMCVLHNAIQMLDLKIS